ncbi:uncharacterized protein BCR38DRAFT_475448 [Pseudomassariella vexata]|uniref:Uncharacterized protein n=1 Tax=Pseudomassariella vexata TaxID=1141098 RepID=A0A1Y2DW55_9PEZI|nr:uncharacterized protein BCR38DRAFT_475448 [Pseudomassariella vexata]ORY63532.1 hypothetical protein BCR38DRAFT_475448 [Pseudomassariella vexata]
MAPGMEDPLAPPAPTDYQRRVADAGWGYFAATPMALVLWRLTAGRSKNPRLRIAARATMLPAGAIMVTWDLWDYRRCTRAVAARAEWEVVRKRMHMGAEAEARTDDMNDPWA